MGSKFTITRELKNEQHTRRKFEKRIQLLKDYFKIKESQGGKLAVTLLRRVKDRSILEAIYRRLCDELYMSYSFETSPTKSELEFLEWFKQEWKLTIHRQFWIGNLCADMALLTYGQPQLGGKRGFRTKGVVFEIDGPIHNTEQKMKKDEWKEKALSDFGMLLWRLTDRQIALKEGLPSRQVVRSNLKRICTREGLMLRYKIWLWTILYHGSEEDLLLVFPRLKNTSKCFKTMIRREVRNETEG